MPGITAIETHEVSRVIDATAQMGHVCDECSALLQNALWIVGTTTIPITNMNNINAVVIFFMSDELNIIFF